MKKKKIIIFADHCSGKTAYGKLCSYIADDLHNSGKYEVIVCGIDYKDVQTNDYYKIDKPYPIYSLYPNPKCDPQAVDVFMKFLSKKNIDYDIIFTINDLWHLWKLPDFFYALRKRQNRKFLWCNWFPVDQVVRSSWIPIIKSCDYPVVMSNYGYQQLKQLKVNYHRIKTDKEKYYKIEDQKQINKTRIKLEVPKNGIIFGFVGRNQKRKNIFDMIKTFKIFNNKYKNSYLYLHTEIGGFDLNIDIHVNELFKGYDSFPVRTKEPEIRYSDKVMNEMYNAIDCLIVPSIAEGVCLPIHEAQLAGCPVIGVNNTSITETLKDGNGILVANSREKIRRMTILEKGYPLELELPVFESVSMLEAMEFVYNKKYETKKIAEKGRRSAEEYQEKLPNWVEYFEEIYEDQKEYADKMDEKRKHRYKWIKTI